MTDYTDADDLRTDLKTLADNHGEIYDDRPTLTVTYETGNGTERTRTGDVWRVSDGGRFEDAVIRFSANIGDGDEDAYYIRVRNGDMTLVSISEQGRETDLGDIVSVEADGLGDDTPTDDTDDEQGSWMVLPDPVQAAAYATPFPDFDRDGEWQVGEVVHDLNVAQMVRIAEQEVDA